MPSSRTCRARSRSRARGAGAVEGGARELDAERKRPGPCGPGSLLRGLAAGSGYFKVVFEVAVPPSGEVIVIDFGGAHQKPVELPPVLLGSRTPALVRMESNVQPRTASTGVVVPTTTPAALPVRHKMVHEYLGVDYDVVWEVVTADLPVLAGTLERIA